MDYINVGGVWPAIEPDAFNFPVARLHICHQGFDMLEGMWVSCDNLSYRNKLVVPFFDVPIDINTYECK
jgi:hypothetical protein